MNITWKKLEDQSYEGFDEMRNRYRQPANQETTTVFLLDGRTGQGWTPEEALQVASEQPISFNIGGVYSAVYTPANGNDPVKHEGYIYKGEYHENPELILHEFDNGFGKSLYIDPDFIGTTWKFSYVRQAHCVYHVCPGLDAFEVRTGESQLALPYIAVIATSPEMARRNAALLLGQKLEDQDTNPDYINHVGHAEFRYVHSVI